MKVPSNYLLKQYHEQARDTARGISMENIVNTQEKTITKYVVKEPGLYKVLIYNDDFTTMEFVVWLLENIFSKTYDEAYELMMTVHKSSYGIAGVYPKDIAVTKAVTSMTYARREGYPLKVEAVAE